MRRGKRNVAVAMRTRGRGMASGGGAAEGARGRGRAWQACCNVLYLLAGAGSRAMLEVRARGAGRMLPRVAFPPPFLPKPLCSDNSSIRTASLVVTQRPMPSRAVTMKAMAMTSKAISARMGNDEKRLARKLHFDDGKKPAEIARTLGRAKSSVTRLPAQPRQPNPIGRPRAITPEKTKSVLKKLDELVTQARRVDLLKKAGGGLIEE